MTFPSNKLTESIHVHQAGALPSRVQMFSSRKLMTESFIHCTLSGSTSSVVSSSVLIMKLPAASRTKTRIG